MRGKIPPICLLGSCDDQARRPELRRVETEPVVRVAPLEEIGVAAAQVEHRPGAEDVHPVADERAVGAPERQLAILRRAAADRAGVADLVALVLTPAEEHAVVRR